MTGYVCRYLKQVGNMDLGAKNPGVVCEEVLVTALEHVLTTVLFSLAEKSVESS